MSSNLSKLAFRILDCFPSGSYALNALLQVLEIEETTEIATAAVECTQQPRLKINPDFVKQHASTPEHLMMLVLHELHHVLLGHTRLFPCATQVDNLVFDAVINATLCRMFPEPAYTSFFTDFYSEKSVPACLLRPATGWEPISNVWPSVLNADRYSKLREVHKSLYSITGADYSELYDAIRSEIAEMPSDLILLGDHERGGSTDGSFESRSPLLYRVARQVVERWPQPPDPIRGRSFADVVKDPQVSVPTGEKINRKRLRDLLCHVAERVGSTAIRPREQVTTGTGITAIPTLSRKSCVLRALGVRPLLYDSHVQVRQRMPTGERVHVYLDVSGSIGPLKGALYAAILDCAEFVVPTVHLFSTVIADVSLKDLKKGKCQSTGGTDIACVAEHMRAHKVRRAVVVTDGYVGTPGGNHREVLSRVQLGVALTWGGSTRQDLNAVANHWTELEGVSW